MPLPAALSLAAFGSAVVSGLTEVLVVRPLRDSSRVSVTLATFGVAGLLSAIVANVWGQYPPGAGPLVSGIGPVVGGLRIAPQDILILIVSVLVLSVLYVLYNHTAFGLRSRASAIDPYLAGQAGVNANVTSLASWSLGGIIAGVSAILISPTVAFSPDLVVRGLAAALVAGMGNMGVAFCCGVIIGLFEALTTYLNRTPGLVDFGLAAFIILLLLVRPNGLWPGRYGADARTLSPY